MDRLIEFFEEPNGGLSAQRLAFLAFTFAIAVPLAWLTFQKQAFPEIPLPIIYLFSTVMLGKVAQSYVESNTTTPTSTPTPTPVPAPAPTPSPVVITYPAPVAPPTPGQ